MVGFALILVIVSVLILVFLSMSLKHKGVVEESYVVDNFLQSVLQDTMNCTISGNFVDVEHLAKKCASDGEGVCENNGMNYCLFLNRSLDRIMRLSWAVGRGNETYYKGYNFTINVLDPPNTITSIFRGNETRNFKGSTQHLENLDITLKLYV